MISDCTPEWPMQVERHLNVDRRSGYSTANCSAVTLRTSDFRSRSGQENGRSISHESPSQGWPEACTRRYHICCALLSHESHRSNSLTGIKISFLRCAGLVDGSLYLAKYHSLPAALSFRPCISALSSRSFCAAAWGSATPEKVIAAYSPLGRSDTDTLSVLGAGRLDLSCMTATD